MAEDRLPVVVLFYHRVADNRSNGWTISNRMFARQVRWLRSHFELVSLEEAQRLVRSGANHRRCASITFDDGYADNCREAIPLLVKERIPCTYFVTVGNVLDGRPFKHDLDQQDPPPPNTLEQLRAMAADGIEIGAHSYTHADLGHNIDRRQLHYEVVTAGEDLQEALGHPVRHFAFPFGQRANLNSEAFEMAYEAGYETVCSAYGGFNFPGDDAFHVQRIPADDSMIRLKNWATIDPRKINTLRFMYGLPGKSESHLRTSSE
jgi:peptidoglycan/xylan/chitin deacetylase (PgdA/CDA1 family)